MDGFVKNTETVKKNLSPRFEELLTLTEMRAAFIDDWALCLKELYCDREDLYANLEMINAFRELEDSLFIPEESLFTHTKEYLKASLEAARRTDGYKLASALFGRINDELPIDPACFFEEAREPEEKGEVCYIDNPITKKVFSRLGLIDRDLRGKTGTDFEGLCDSVSSGRSEYCILPIESSGGELMNFLRLISEHGLKKCLTVTVTENDESFTRFALLRRDLLPLMEPLSHKLFLDAVLSFKNGEELGSFILSLPLMGGEIYRIRSATDSLYSGDEQRYRISIKLEKDSLCRLLFCLFLCFPSCTVSGIYEMI